MLTEAEKETIRRHLHRHYSVSGAQFHDDGRVTLPGRTVTSEPEFVGNADEILAEAETCAFDNQMEDARELLADRIEAAAGGNLDLLYQFRCSIDDALANEWQEGISTEEWAERAAKRVGI